MHTHSYFFLLRLLKNSDKPDFISGRKKKMSYNDFPNGHFK